MFKSRDLFAEVDLIFFCEKNSSSLAHNMPVLFATYFSLTMHMLSLLSAPKTGDLVDEE